MEVVFFSGIHTLAQFLVLANAVSSPIAPHPVLLLPFILILAAIALMPFVHAAWWERNFHYTAVGLGLATVLPYCLVLGEGARMLHVAHEYVSFIALIGALFTVAGGIHLSVEGETTPLGNALFLLAGAVLANVIGTTGASMLLIRPWIALNRRRVTAFHVVFFIFIIANAGGCLTPIGDPPLFLGYLRGVPFWWVAQHCWSAWLIAVSALTSLFWVFDRRNYARVPFSLHAAVPSARLQAVTGKHNVVFLAIVVGAVFVNGPAGLREMLIVGAALGSWFTTDRSVHKANGFHFHPIKEVAWLFAGIFATMVPALDYLQAHAGSLGLDSEMKFFWMTGIPSGFLDNAPTYLTLLATAVGQHGGSIDQVADVHLFLSTEGQRLVAISLGAVFFGGLTYIGNGPNFMVRSIAEQAHVKVPSFFGYLAKYALPILVPVLGLIALLFFSRWRLF